MIQLHGQEHDRLPALPRSALRANVLRFKHKHTERDPKHIDGEDPPGFLRKPLNRLYRRLTLWLAVLEDTSTDTVVGEGRGSCNHLP